MKIALAQLNYHIGNFEQNTAKIIQAIHHAEQAGADLIVFSELSVCGYPPQDLLEQADFIQSTDKAVATIAGACTRIAAVIGAPVLNENQRGKKLFNAALWLQDGKVSFVQHKTLLPTYDVFDEYRYFEPNRTFDVIQFRGHTIALSICEDLWDHQPVENSFARNSLYTISPAEELAKLNPDLLINIAASPYSYNQGDKRKNILINNSRQYQLPIVYVNQVGGNTELIFDGGSMVLNRNGEIAYEMPLFEEAIHFIELDDILHIPSREYPTESEDLRLKNMHQALLLGLKDYFVKSGFNKATLGLSGGIDSALTLAIAAEALGSENIKVLLMPSQFSSEHSIQDAKDLAEKLNISYQILPIHEGYQSLLNTLQPIFQDLPFGLAEENLQARIRGTLLMALSNKLGYLLLNTSNKSEAAVGYGTLYGDMNGALSVLGDVYKTDVFKMSRWINRNEEIIPWNTINKPPSAELRPDQKDSDSLPDYDLLDAILFRYIELKQSASKLIGEGFDAEIVNRVIRLVNLNEHKRFQAPPVLRVSSKAFGMGRRMPIVAKYS